MVDRYLMHHGIKGQKWGVRRFQNEDGSYTAEGKERRKEVTNYRSEGGTIKKGSTLYRVSLHEKDPTYDNKKYVSTNEFDNALWEDNLIKGYRSKYSNKDGTPLNMYGIKYKTVKDIKVASATKLGEKTYNILKKDPSVIKKTVADISKVNAKNTNALLNYLNEGNYAGVGAMSLRYQNDTAKQIVKDLSKEGYGAVTDVLGYNVSYDPLIILDPDKKMKRVSSIKYE